MGFLRSAGKVLLIGGGFAMAVHGGYEVLSRDSMMNPELVKGAADGLVGLLYGVESIAGTLIAAAGLASCGDRPLYEDSSTKDYRSQE